MQTVRAPFLARQFPGGQQLAVGIKFIALKDKIRYRFRIADLSEIYEFDVEEAIKYAKKYPPPYAHGSFLHNDMIILPVSFCAIHKDPQLSFF